MSASPIGFVCPLCFSKYPISECRLLKCYHGFCEGCISKWFEIRGGSGPASGRLSCPECREPADRSHLAPLFLDIVVLDNDSESQSHTSNTQVCLDTSISNHATFVMNGLGRIGPQSESGSIVRAGKEIEKVADAVKSNVSPSSSHYEMIERLLQAVDDFKQRIGPPFEKATVQQDRLYAFENKVNKLEEEIEILKSDNASCQLHSEQALLLSESLAARVKKDADIFSRRIGEKEHEICCLRDECSSRDAEIQRLMKVCRIKDKEIARCISQISDKNNLGQAPRAFSSTRLTKTKSHDRSTSFDDDLETNLHAKESKLVTLSSSGEEDDDPYPTPTSPSIGAKSRQDAKNPAPCQVTAKSKPKFISDWNLERPSSTKKRKIPSDLLPGFPLRLDDKGRPRGSVLLGTRQRLGKKF